jgi:prepilin peptidase CpaA
VNPLVIAAVVAAGIAACIDYRTGRIPNVLTAGAIGFGVAFRLIAPIAHGNATEIRSALVTSCAGKLLAAVVPFGLWRAKALGGGDLKLFVALGVMLGPMLGLEAQMMAFACGALIVPVQLLFRGELLRTLARSLTLVTNVFTPAAKKRAVDAASMTWFRLGPAIFAGTLLAVLVRSAHG